jgi:hypothetical protein
MHMRDRHVTLPKICEILKSLDVSLLFDPWLFGQQSASETPISCYLHLLKPNFELWDAKLSKW